MVMDSCEPTATNNWNYMSTWDYLLGF